MSNPLVRYAVVGLGHIAQTAILPAFQNCRSSQVAGLVSTDEEKLAFLGRKYRLVQSACYNDYDECLRSGKVDAVYLAVPNHLHCDYTVRAANAGIHVLCEKPMAVTSAECEKMIRACEDNHVKLMIAYRLHFEATNLTAIEMIHDKKRIGDPRIFHSFHSQVTNFPNVRTLPIEIGGGPTYDIGVYDINAARYIFQDEPISVFAECVHSSRPPYRNIEESMSVILRFPGERIASILYSFGATTTEAYRVAGTQGDLRVAPAYAYLGKKQLELTIAGKTRKRTFKARDHFSPEIDYFSKCIREGRDPEPSGLEGLADIRIIEAIYQSAQEHAPISLAPTIKKRNWPGITQEINRPPVRAPKAFHAEKPTRKKAA